MSMNAFAPRHDFVKKMPMGPGAPARPSAPISASASAYGTRVAVLDPLEPMMAAERADRALLRGVAVIAGAALAGALLAALL